MSISNVHCKPEKANRQLSTLRYTRNEVTEFKDKQEIPSIQGKQAGHLPKGKKDLSGLSPLSTARH